MDRRTAKDLIEEVQTFLKVLPKATITKGVVKGPPKGYGLKFTFKTRPTIESTRFLDSVAESEGAGLIPEGKTIKLIFADFDLGNRWHKAFGELKKKKASFKSTEQLIEFLRKHRLLTK